MSFWFLACGLVILSLALTLLPLRRRQQTAQLSAPTLAAAPQASNQRWTAAILIALMPLLTLGLYQHLGAPSVLGTQHMLQARGQHDVDGMLLALEDKLKTSPDDAEALYVLGRSYLALQRHADAEVTLAKAARLAPHEARMLSQYAEVLAMNNNGNLQAKAWPLIEQALELDPEDEKALELAGLAAYQRQEWAQAVHFWRRLLKRIPAESEFHQDMSKAIQEAEEQSAQASGLGERAKLQPNPKKQTPH